MTASRPDAYGGRLAGPSGRSASCMPSEPGSSGRSARPTMPRRGRPTSCCATGTTTRGDDRLLPLGRAVTTSPSARSTPTALVAEPGTS